MSRKENKRQPIKVDTIDEWMKALYEITFPEHLHDSNFGALQETWIQERYKQAGGKDRYGVWHTLPYKGQEFSVHTPGKDDYFHLLTSRNKYIYTETELQTIQKAKVCILGQSIGGNVAHVLAHSGYGHLCLADYDTLDPTNLNRILFANALDVGRPKLNVIAEEAKMVNPFMKIEVFEEGVSEDNLSDFIKDADVILELVDDFKMKIRVRELARKSGIPVFMTTNVGRWRIIDIERYDLDSKLPLFNGLVEEQVFDDILADKLSPEDINRYARELVGAKNIDPRALDSLPKIGIKHGIAGRPQIASTVTSNAGSAVFVMSWILGCFKDLGVLESGRKVIKENELVTP